MTMDKEKINIRISGLSNGEHEYHFSVPPADLTLPEEFDSPVTVDAVLDKSARQMYLRASIAASGTFTCDRCLERFARAVTSQIALFYVYSELDAGSFPADDVRIISPDTMYIDITDDVRQSILLAVPLKMVCTDECKGLCPHCGTNWNTASCNCRETSEESDPRWDRLKNII
jgi:uncharacterized protein